MKETNLKTLITRVISTKYTYDVISYATCLLTELPLCPTLATHTHFVGEG